MNNHPPPYQVNHDITCFYNKKGDKWGKADQDEDMGGVRHECEGQRYGEEDKGGKKN